MWLWQIYAKCRHLSTFFCVFLLTFQFLCHVVACRWQLLIPLCIISLFWCWAVGWASSLVQWCHAPPLLAFYQLSSGSASPLASCVKHTQRSSCWGNQRLPAVISPQRSLTEYSTGLPASVKVSVLQKHNQIHVFAAGKMAKFLFLCIFLSTKTVSGQ